MVIEDIVRSWASRMLAVMLAAALALVLAVFLLPAPAVSAQSRRSPGPVGVSPQPNGCWWFANTEGEIAQGPDPCSSVWCRSTGTIHVFYDICCDCRDGVRRLCDVRCWVVECFSRTTGEHCGFDFTGCSAFNCRESSDC